MGAMVYAGGAVLKFYAQFAQRMGEVNSITDLSQAEFQALSTDVRQLSQAMGKEAAQSAAALYDILSSGVSPARSAASRMVWSSSTSMVWPMGSMVSS